MSHQEHRDSQRIENMYITVTLLERTHNPRRCRLHTNGELDGYMSVSLPGIRNNELKFSRIQRLQNNWLHMAISSLVYASEFSLPSLESRSDKEGKNRRTEGSFPKHGNSYWTRNDYTRVSILLTSWIDIMATYLRTTSQGDILEKAARTHPKPTAYQRRMQDEAHLSTRLWNNRLARKFGTWGMQSDSQADTGPRQSGSTVGSTVHPDRAAYDLQTPSGVANPKSRKLSMT
jgi:hypothetical protein